MTGVLLGIVAVLLILATWASSLHLALQEPSRSELEHRFTRRAGKGGKFSADGPLEWIFRRRAEVAIEVALIRTVLRVGVTVCLVLAIVSGEPDVFEVLIAGGIAILLLWFSTSVLSGAIAEYLGPSLIVRGLGFLRLSDLILWPVARVAMLFDEVVRRLSGANLREHEAEDRLRRSIEDSTLEGELDEAAAEMLENVVEFNSTEVGTVMTPRTDIEGLPLSDDLVSIRD